MFDLEQLANLVKTGRQLLEEDCQPMMTSEDLQKLLGVEPEPLLWEGDNA